MQKSFKAGMVAEPNKPDIALIVLEEEELSMKISKGLKNTNYAYYKLILSLFLPIIVIAYWLR